MRCDKLDVKLYQSDAERTLSMRDLLNYFLEHGSLRVSDLHLKVGSPPVYRVDGLLVKMKGRALDSKTVEGLARTLLSDIEWEQLSRDRSVDSSYLGEKMQFRLNCFYENDGPALAVRAL